MTYRAPLDDMQLALALAGAGRLQATERFGGVDAETARGVLEAAARLSEDVLAPLQRPGDLNPARLENGVVRTPAGFAAGFRAIAEGGWIGMAAAPEFGGMGLPMALVSAVNEMMSSACLSLQLAPLMAQGQIEALEHHADAGLKALYLPKLASGEWTATMNLTEAQAGSDVGALRSTARPAGDGTWAVSGQKIFITWGDHDLAENVCHLVLARTPGAPAGTRGISLFLVPKLLPGSDGRPGARNSLSVVSLEHKLGLHGSPTAVMQYDGATGWMVGPEGGGMAAMFTMMNNARLGVGLQGVGIAEAAWQQARAFAARRVQGSAPWGAAIDGHPDVRRMLARMRALTFAARAIAYDCAVSLDLARAGAGAEGQARAAFLTPIAKAFGTDTGCEVADLGIQVHGGMGFIEETGAAQLWRDVRVTAIYEGTNGIQAADLAGRKLADGGEAARTVLAGLTHLPERAAKLAAESLAAMLAHGAEERASAAVPFLRLMALVLGAEAHGRAAEADPARAPLARFYMAHVLPETEGLAPQIRAGAGEIGRDGLLGPDPA
jgi:hypothetical protein